MKLLIIAAASTAILVSSAYAQNSQPQVLGQRLGRRANRRLAPRKLLILGLQPVRPPSRLLVQWGRHRMGQGAGQPVPKSRSCAAPPAGGRTEPPN